MSRARSRHEDTMDISMAPLSRSNLTRFNFSVTFDEKVECWPLLSIVVNHLPQLKMITLRVNGWWQNIHMLYSGVIAPLCLLRNLHHLDITIGGHVSKGHGLAGLQTFPPLQKPALRSMVLHTLDFTVDHGA
ncbi:hypothetical protein EDB19DRAFT_1912191 [Suillus lakei]|nr:hypothetical protein EDB19DRAFT_1912191 [Suillus lakei]